MLRQPFSLRVFLWLALAFGTCSVVQFIGLVCNLPIIVISILGLLAVARLGWWMLREADAEFDVRKEVMLAGLTAATATAVLWKGLPLAEYWGGWDAWAMWNYHSRFLQDGEHWQRLFLSTYHDHPDYPLCLPGGIAFFKNLSPGAEESVPFCVTLGTTLLCPLMVAASLYRRSLVAAAVGALILATSTSFLKNGLSQYADTLLGCYLLVACVTVRARYCRHTAVVCGTAAGLMLWTKAEGILLLPLFCVCHARILIEGGRWKSFLAGLTIPLFVWAAFKIFYAPPGDMDLPSLSAAWDRIATEGRLSKVSEYFSNVMKNDWVPVLVLLAVLCFWCFWKKKGPGITVVFILLAAAVYSSIYLLTPYDPDWHLRTSYDRLLHGMMPVAVWAALDRMLPGEKAIARK